MAKRDFHEDLLRDLETLRLPRIAAIYKEVLDQASSEGWTLLHVLAHLVASEAAERTGRVLESRIKRARLPKLKTIEEYDFNFPKRLPKQKILRVFDCDFVEKRGNVVFVGNQGFFSETNEGRIGYAATRSAGPGSVERVR